MAVHVSPCFRVELGDTVTVGEFCSFRALVAITDLGHLGQCRPLSKTVRFNVLRVAKNKAAAKAFGKF